MSRWIATVAVALGASAMLAGASDAKLVGNPGSFIAFARGGDIRVTNDPNGAFDLAAFDVDITSSPGVVDAAPSWGRPDHNCLKVNGELDLASGRTLVYESRPAGSDSDIVRAHLIGAPPALESSQNLTAAGSQDEGAPAVGEIADAGPDNTVEVIVFTRGPVGHRHLWAMFLDGSHETQLTSGAGDESNPDWSSYNGQTPDGQVAAASVVYQTSDAGGRQQLATISVGYNSEVPDQLGVVALSAPRFITGGPEQHGDPSWYGGAVSDTHDPTRVVHVSTAAGSTYLDFVEQGEPTSGALFAPASVPAPLVRQLTGDPGGDLAPSWLPGGDAVVFESDRAQAGNTDIYRIKADGTDLVRLTRDALADHAPDGESIGGGCLNPAPYGPRPGTQARNGRPQAPHGSGESHPTPPKPALRVTELRVTKSGKGGKRNVVVRFVVNVPGRATLRLSRGRRTVASKVTGLAGGKARILLSVPRSEHAGRYKLRLKVTAGSVTRSFGRAIRIRSARSRR